MINEAAREHCVKHRVPLLAGLVTTRRMNPAGCEPARVLAATTRSVAAAVVDVVVVEKRRPLASGVGHIHTTCRHGTDNHVNEHAAARGVKGKEGEGGGSLVTPTTHSPRLTQRVLQDPRAVGVEAARTTRRCQPRLSDDALGAGVEAEQGRYRAPRVQWRPGPLQCHEQLVCAPATRLCDTQHTTRCGTTRV